MSKIAPYALLALTIAAMLAGAWFYMGQISTTNPLLWLFVIDCPLYVVLAAPILLFGKPENPIYRFVVSCGLVLYGSWTLFVLFFSPEVYFSESEAIISWILVFGHFGMIFEAFLALPKLEEFGLRGILISLGWFLFNLHLDYFNGAFSTHPWIPERTIPATVAFTAASTLAVPIGLALIANTVGKAKIIAKIRESLRFA